MFGTIFHLQFITNLANNFESPNQVFFLMCSGYTETHPSIHEGYCGGTNRNYSEATTETVAGEISDLGRSVQHDWNDRGWSLPENLEPQLYQTTAEEACVFVYCTQFLGPNAVGVLSSSHDELQSLHNLDCACRRHGSSIRCACCEAAHVVHHMLLSSNIASRAPKGFRECSHHDVNVLCPYPQFLRDTPSCGAYGANGVRLIEVDVSPIALGNWNDILKITNVAFHTVDPLND
mmetsp:Transcript_3126/g.7285  ORF Transcript_3126/g.7285 Transcript_3126/m.7285 type:complete len:234 (+) Transcript_3126:588-1289(+)